MLYSTLGFLIHHHLNEEHHHERIIIDNMILCMYTLLFTYFLFSSLCVSLSFSLFVLSLLYILYTDEERKKKNIGYCLFVKMREFFRLSVAKRLLIGEVRYYSYIYIHTM